MKAGLKKYIEDERDFTVGALFTLPRIKDIPEEFEVGSFENIKDQKLTDYCAAFAGCAVSEDQEGVELDPLYQFMKAKIIEGNPEGWGLRLKDVAESFVKFGSIPKSESPFNIDTPRSTIIDPKSWFPSLDIKAKEHKKESYIFVKKYRNMDFFDVCRASMWKFKCGVIGGVEWSYEWTTDEDGIVEKYQKAPGFGHALAIKGVKKIKGELYLKAKLSNGPIGDNGVYYFSRSAINKGFAEYGGILFVDKKKEDLKYCIEHDVKADLSWISELLQVLTKLLK